MFDIGWTELLIIGVVALIVVGPKDLPVMFRTLGQFTGKLRGMAREFTRAMDDAADQAGAKDIARDLRSMSNPRSAATQKFKQASGLDDIQKSVDDLMTDEVEDEGARDTTTASHGANTKALAEKRAAEAKSRREEAVRRANDRSSTFTGFETTETGEGAAPSTKTPAPTPGSDTPSSRTPATAETAGEAADDAPRGKARGKA